MCRLATAVDVAAGLFSLHFSNIPTAAHAINEPTCCKEKQAWIQTAQAERLPCPCSDTGQSIRSPWCVSAEAQTWPVCTAPSSVSSGGCTDYSSNRLHLTKDTDCSVRITNVTKWTIVLMQRPYFLFGAIVWSNGFKRVTSMLNSNFSTGWWHVMVWNFCCFLKFILTDAMSR